MIGVLNFHFDGHLLVSPNPMPVSQLFIVETGLTGLVVHMTGHELLFFEVLARASVTAICLAGIYMRAETCPVLRDKSVDDEVGRPRTEIGSASSPLRC